MHSMTLSLHRKMNNVSFVKQKHIRVKQSRKPVVRLSAFEEESLGYKEQVVLKATGEVARFNQLLPQYIAA